MFPILKKTSNKSLWNKSKQIKEVFDGDIYKKYLKKASTLWEDFTTGKKKTKEESAEIIKPNVK